MSLQVGAVNPGAPVSAEVNTRTEARTAASTSLLPEPGARGLDGTQDALAMLYSLLAKQGQLSLTIGESSVTSTQKEQDAQLDQEKQAQLAQQQAEASAGGFWHDLLSVAETVAKVAAVVVAVAAAAVATFFTGGAAAVGIVTIAAVVLSAGGALVSATQCFGKLSDYFGLGMEAVGAVLTLGMSTGVIASSAAADATQASASTLATVTKTVGTVAQVTAGVSTVTEGVSSIEVAKFQSDSEDDQADVQQALDMINQQSRTVDLVIAGLKSTQESNQKALELVAGAAQTYGQTLTTLASMGKA
jgi:hypothetical protein